MRMSRTGALQTLEHSFEYSNWNLESSVAAAQGMAVGEAGYSSSQLGLGQLSGNEFTITLRDLRALAAGGADTLAAAVEPEPDAAALEARARGAVDSLRGTGFINYFGLQRFGASCGARTHVVGARRAASNADCPTNRLRPPSRPHASFLSGMTLFRRIRLARRILCHAGAALIRGDWQAAVDMLLAPRTDEARLGPRRPVVASPADGRRERARLALAAG